MATDNPAKIVFKIIFDNPTKISISQEPDFMWFRAIKDISCVTDNVRYIIKKGSRIKSFLPP